MSSDINVVKLELQPFVKRSFTTGPGNVGGTTLVDLSLTEPNDFWNGMAILIRTAGPTVDCSRQLRRVLDYDLPTHTLTVNVAFSGQIEADVQYVMFFPTIFQTNIVAGGGLKADLRQVLGQGADIAPGNELLTEDTGLNTNPERWMHDHHWDSGVQLVLNAAAAVNLGAPVAAGAKRRIRSITARNTALANTVITVSQLAPAQNRVSFDVPSQTTRVWSEEDGAEFVAGVQVQISSSAAAAGAETYIHASGVEA